MSIEEELRKETEKWLEKIKSKKYELKDPDKKRLIDNMNAYIKDSEIYLKDGKLVLGFEAIVWSWAYYELLLEFDIIKEL